MAKPVFLWGGTKGFDLGNCLKCYQLGVKHVQVQNSENFNFGIGDFTIGIWWYQNGEDYYNLCSKRQNVTQGYWIQKSLGKVLSWRVNTEIIDTINSPTPAIEGILKPNDWNFSLFTRRGIANGSNNLLITDYKIILNGQDIPIRFRSGAQESPLINANIDSSAVLQLGAQDNTVSRDVLIDDIFFLNTSISVSEAFTMYKGGLGNHPPQRTWDNVKGYWDFNMSNGRVVPDKARLYNTYLTTSQDGLLINYTDAEVAANGQPQSGQIAWHKHSTKQIITV